MLHVDEYRDWKSLATLRDAWNALLTQTAGATYFQSYDWLETYWKHYGDKQRLRVLAVVFVSGTARSQRRNRPRETGSANYP